MQSVGSAMFHSAFVALLVAGGLTVGCVSNDDPDDKGSAGSSATAGSSGSGTAGGSAGSTAAGGGGSGGGGTGGTGGMVAMPPACATVAELSGTSPEIADFEDMTSATGTYTFESAGLLGGTYSYTDMMSTLPSTVSLSLAAGHDEASTQALVGSITNDTWGGGIGLWLACMDASVYTGVTFWARGDSPVGDIKIALTVNEVEVVSKGGDCPDAGPCDAPFAEFAVTDEWQQFTFKWEDFSDGNAAGTPVPPSVGKLYGIGFNVPNDNTMRDLELAIDDVAFTTE